MRGWPVSGWVALLVAGAVADGRGSDAGHAGRSVRREGTRHGYHGGMIHEALRWHSVSMSGLPASNTTEDGLSIIKTAGPGASGKPLGREVSAGVRRCEACRGNSRVYN